MTKTSQKNSTAYKVVSFYTPDELYIKHAENLIKSLDQFQIPHTIECCNVLDSWEQVCASKSEFIYNQWRASELPIVWIDADATVEAKPTLFEDLDADFAIHKWNGWQFATGTIYFSKSPATEQLLQQWVLRCKADPHTWDQIHLQSAWCDIAATSELKTYVLPRSYCQIFDATEEEPCIIKQWQASREKKESLPPSPFPTLEHLDSGIEARRQNHPWRTAKETFWISQEVKHIKPEIDTEYPEGTYIEEALRKAIGSAFPVLEAGCGVGRLATFFNPDEYLGIDVNPNALLQARTSLPQHNLRLTDDGIAFPPSASTFFYTALLYVSDKALPILLARINKTCKKVIIAGIMDQRWRRGGNPPVFSRDAETYILEMQKLGYTLTAEDKHPYERYDKAPWNIGHDTCLTLLTFQRN